MTKEEAIKEAWIDVYGVDKINQIMSNSNERTGYIEGFMLKIFKLDTNNEKLEKKFDGVVNNYRPKSLQGIESNNGWIKIESEEDLPKEDGDFFIIFEDGCIFTDSFIAKYKNFKTFAKRHITHYQPIEKPKPPIY